MRFYEIERSSDGEIFRVNICEKCEPVFTGIVNGDRDLNITDYSEWVEGCECIVSCALCKNMGKLSKKEFIHFC